MQKMRILLVSAAALPVWKCGVSTVIDDILSMLHDHTTAVFALDIFGGHDRIEKHSNVQYWFTKTVVSPKCAYISDSCPETIHINERFKKCLKTFRPDIVHFHTPQYFSLSLIKMAKEAGAHTIVTLHDWWWICPSQFFTPQKGVRCENISRESCLRCMKITEADYDNRMKALKNIEVYVDQFTCVSSILYSDIVSKLPHLRHRLSIVTNAVSERAEVFVEMKKPIRFVFLGGRSEIKGYSEVLNAFEGIQNTDDWKLEIYGCKESIDIFKMIKNYISHPILFVRKVKQIIQPRRKLRYLRDKILRRTDGEVSYRVSKENAQRIFYYPTIGKQERDQILRASHVVLMCSQVQESFSLVTYEAMANGCCVVSTPCSGPIAIVKDRENGILLKDSKAESLASAITYVLEHPDEMERFRRNAYKESKHFPTKEQVVNKYIELYNKGISVE